jgi:predicted DNA-binding protein YlxM (UPF0122 family)
MANTENRCSDLEIKDFHSSTKDALGLIFEKQKELQERLGFNFDGYTIKEIADFWMVNKHALSDEINEMFDALGGINDGIGNAGWKYWKKDNAKTADMKVEDLSREDQLELFYEWIDGLHFYINFAISMGMTSKDVVNLYMAKNAHNHERQDNNY